MPVTPNFRNCNQCGKPLKGRQDKKFCNDSCRNIYNNKLKSGDSKALSVRNINNALLKNRRILESQLPPGDDTARVSLERLQNLGFQFRYLTHLYTTKAGKTYRYCYDYGYLPLENDWYLIVRQRD